MSSRNATLADALVSALNAASTADDGTFSQRFTAARTYLIEIRPPEMDPAKLYVHVVSAHDEPQQLGRGRQTRTDDMTVDIAVRKKLQSFAAGGAIDNVEVDPLVQFVEEVAAFCGPETLGELGWQRTEIPWLFVPDHLQRLGVFTGVVSVTFKK